MKKILFLAAVVGALLFGAPQANAQTINISIQPSWGPAGYDYAEFYYLPELNIYYDVINGLYYYLSGSQWIGRKTLPVKYKKYNLHDMYKVVLNGKPQPWLDNKQHKKDYKCFINDRTQTPIRHTTDPKYEPARKNTTPWVDNQPTIRKTSTTSARKQVDNRREEGVRKESSSKGSSKSSSNNNTSVRRR